MSMSGSTPEISPIKGFNPKIVVRVNPRIACVISCI